MKTYPSRRIDLDLGKWGVIRYHEWLFGHYMPPLNEALVDHFATYVRPGSFAIDIGAFTGDTTLPMALATGRDGLVLAFEPGPASFSFLLENASLNSTPQIVCAHNAVVATPGPVTFHYTDAGYINGGYSNSLDAKPAGCGNLYPHTVEGVHLSDYLATHYPSWLPKLSFIKIDTEGYDKEILKANRALIEQYRPAIQVEVYPFLSQRERADLAATLLSLRYTWSGGDEMFTAPDPKPKDVVCTPL